MLSKSLLGFVARRFFLASFLWFLVFISRYSFKHFSSVWSSISCWVYVILFACMCRELVHLLALRLMIPIDTFMKTSMSVSGCSPNCYINLSYKNRITIMNYYTVRPIKKNMIKFTCHDGLSYIIYFISWDDGKTSLHLYHSNCPLVTFI